MAIKKVKLTEADLNRIVKKVMNEVRPPRIANRAAGQQQGGGAGGCGASGGTSSIGGSGIVIIKYQYQ
jgi:hypothetical protein